MVNTYQPINPTALEALALMRDQAEYRQVTISSTAVGNALCVTQETARRNMRSLVDMNLLEVVVPQKGALAATYRIPAAAVALLDALDGVKRPIATRTDRQEVLYATRDGSVTIEEGDWEVSADVDASLLLCVRGSARVTVPGDVSVVASESARVVAYADAAVTAGDCTFVRAYGAEVSLYGNAVGVVSQGGAVTAFDSACVYATNSAYVVACDNTTWHATDTVVVRAGGRSRGTLSGRAMASLTDEAVARASWYASVLLDGDAIAEGGEQVRQEDISSSKGVLELYGAVRGGKAHLWKVLPEDCVSGRPFNKPTEWDIDSDVECDEWLPDPIREGGLFLYATLAHAVAAAVKDEVIVEVTADPTDVFSVGDGVVKARRVHVVEEMMWKR